MRFNRLKAGAAGQQYAIVIGLIGVVAISAITAVGGNISRLFGGTSNLITAVTNASIGATPASTGTTTTPPALPANCVEYGGYSWCAVPTTSGCGNPYNSGPTSLGAICSAASRSWAGDHTLEDATAYTIANLLRAKLGYATRVANDGCGGSSGGENTFTLDAGGICARESRNQTAADMPCAPWGALDGGSTWRVFSRCQ